MHLKNQMIILNQEIAPQKRAKRFHQAAIMVMIFQLNQVYMHQLSSIEDDFYVGASARIEISIGFNVM